MTTLEIMKRAKAAAPELAVASTAQKNRALECMAESLLAHMQDILAANAQDVEAARGRIRAALGGCRVRRVGSGDVAGEEVEVCRRDKRAGSDGGA